MFIYIKKIYLIVFLVLFTSFAQALANTDTNNNDLVPETPKILPTIEPGIYFELAKPVVGCQAVYTVQDRLMLDAWFLNQMFKLNETGELESKLNVYRGYLTDMFNGTVVVLDELKKLALPQGAYSEEETADIIRLMVEHEVKMFNEAVVLLWAQHSQQKSGEFISFMTTTVQSCFLQQENWNGHLNNLKQDINAKPIEWEPTPGLDMYLS